MSVDLVENSTLDFPQHELTRRGYPIPITTHIENSSLEVKVFAERKYMVPIAGTQNLKIKQKQLTNRPRVLLSCFLVSYRNFHTFQKEYERITTNQERKMNWPKSYKQTNPPWKLTWFRFKGWHFDRLKRIKYEFLVSWTLKNKRNVLLSNV